MSVFQELHDFNNAALALVAEQPIEDRADVAEVYGTAVELMKNSFAARMDDQKLWISTGIYREWDDEYVLVTERNNWTRRKVGAQILTLMNASTPYAAIVPPSITGSSAAAVSEGHINDPEQISVIRNVLRSIYLTSSPCILGRLVLSE